MYTFFWNTVYIRIAATVVYLTYVEMGSSKFNKQNSWNALFFHHVVLAASKIPVTQATVTERFIPIGILACPELQDEPARTCRLESPVHVCWRLDHGLLIYLYTHCIPPALSTC